MIDVSIHCSTKASGSYAARNYSHTVFGAAKPQVAVTATNNAIRNAA